MTLTFAVRFDPLTLKVCAPDGFGCTVLKTLSVFVLTDSDGGGGDTVPLTVTLVGAAPGVDAVTVLVNEPTFVPVSRTKTGVLVTTPPLLVSVRVLAKAMLSTETAKLVASFAVTEMLPARLVPLTTKLLLTPALPWVAVRPETVLGKTVRLGGGTTAPVTETLLEFVPLVSKTFVVNVPKVDPVRRT